MEQGIQKKTASELERAFIRWSTGIMIGQYHGPTFSFMVQSQIPPKLKPYLDHSSITGRPRGKHHKKKERSPRFFILLISWGVQLNVL